MVDITCYSPDVNCLQSEEHGSLQYCLRLIDLRPQIPPVCGEVFHRPIRYSFGPGEGGGEVREALGALRPQPDPSILLTRIKWARINPTGRAPKGAVPRKAAAER